MRTSPDDNSKDSRDSVTMAPRLRTEKKLTDFPTVARSLSGADESASSTAPTFLAIWTTMKPQCVVNRAKNQPLTSHQFCKW